MDEEVTYPALQEVCEQADLYIGKLRRKRLLSRIASTVVAIVTVLLSVALAQQPQLKSFLDPQGFTILAYLLAVIVALEKYFQPGKKDEAIQQAITVLLKARNIVYTDEKEEITRRENRPVEPEFAARLVRRVGDARALALDLVDRPTITTTIPEPTPPKRGPRT